MKKVKLYEIASDSKNYPNILRILQRVREREYSIVYKKWCAARNIVDYRFEENYIVFENDNDATLFSLTFVPNKDSTGYHAEMTDEG
jgi:hypothetical protein